MNDCVVLRPLEVSDAAVMSAVLADPSLYEFTGGEPPSVSELESRYAMQTRGHSADGSEEWINLVALTENQPIGFVQATVLPSEATAEISWVIGRPWQRRGYATQAAQGLVEVLKGQGVRKLVAHIHPQHAASQAVARSLDMIPTRDIVEGEVRWLVDLDEILS